MKTSNKGNFVKATYYEELYLLFLNCLIKNYHYVSLVFFTNKLVSNNIYEDLKVLFFYGKCILLFLFFFLLHILHNFFNISAKNTYINNGNADETY